MIKRHYGKQIRDDEVGIRFRKSIKLAPGIRMNFSGSGIGWTLGPRGATIGIGKRGARLNTSFMGFSASEQLTKPQKHQPRLQQPGTTTFTLTCTVGDDGTLAFTDENGHLVPESTVALAKKQKREQLLALMQQKCDEINQTIDELGTIHLFTPKPNERPTFTPMEFGILRPLAPKPRKPSLMDRLFKKRLGRLEAANAQALAAFKEDLAAWQRKEDNFQAEMKARQEMILHGIYEDTEAMETWLEKCLQDIVWPRETYVSFELQDSGSRILVDVDLPEVEDMPSCTAVMPTRGFKLSVKQMTPTAVQKLYMAHVHAIAFRIIGETFAALPLVETVVLSGYSQRPDKATGQLKDDYLLSVRVTRDDWSHIDFERLAHIDVIEALARFDLRRQMSKTGIFRAIEPHYA